MSRKLKHSIFKHLVKGFSFLFLLAFINIFATAENIDSLKIDGNYYGENLIVINPMSNNSHIVKSVSVNNIITKDEIESSVFEIDFSSLNLKSGDPVAICIKYVAGNVKPEIFNPQILLQKIEFAFSNAGIDKKNNTIIWNTIGSSGEEPFEVEQYCWEKWVRIGVINVTDSVSENHYESPFYSHKGKNLFRVKVVDSNGIINYSEPIKYVSRSEEVFIKNKKFVDEIEFTAKTMYQLYDEKGELRLSGTDLVVDITSIESGKYWINYDNKTEMIKVK